MKLILGSKRDKERKSKSVNNREADTPHHTDSTSLGPATNNVPNSCSPGEKLAPSSEDAVGESESV